MKSVRVWDPLVRIFHWSLVTLFAAIALIVDTESKLHEMIGYGVMALIGLRLIWGFVGPRHARFSDFPPSVAASLEQVQEMATGRRHAHVGHSPLGALMIYNLLLALALIVVSGYMMTTNTWFGIRWVKDLHEIAASWAEISALAHVAAVIVETRRLKVNLVRAMVTGVKQLPERSEQQ